MADIQDPDQPGGMPVARLSSRDVGGRAAASTIREFYGRELMRMDLVDRSRTGLAHFDITVGALGPAIWAHCASSAFETRRTEQLMKDGSDDVMLSMTTAGMHVESGNEAFFVQPGAAMLVSKARSFRAINNGPDTSACVAVPHARLAMLVPDLGEAPLISLARGAPGVDMLLAYARLAATNADANRQQRAKAGDHLLELLATIIRPDREADGEGSPRRISEARFEAIKSTIRSHLFHNGLSLERIAALQGVTPRYVQRLFARQGTSFSDYVRDQRLQSAWLALTDPDRANIRILSIALECGFNDVTTFTRAFRRQFGMTPREARDVRPGDDAGE